MKGVIEKEIGEEVEMKCTTTIQANPNMVIDTLINGKIREQWDLRV